jgi:hypothetical protein
VSARVAETSVGGITVSTVELEPGRYETCLFDDRGGRAAGNPSEVVVTGMPTRAEAVATHDEYANMTAAELLAHITT